MVAAESQHEATGGVEFIGPFTHHEVVVNGWTVPHLSATPMNGGIVHLTLDSRFGLDLPVADAEMVVPFIADCIAVAMGYACHPHATECPEPISRHPFARMNSMMPGAFPAD